MSPILESGSPSRTRKERKAATRAALLAAARLCFAKQGYVGTQVGDIAEAAGVAHGTFYVHFSSKDAVLGELLTAFNEGLVERLRAVEAGSRMRGVVELESLVRRMAHTFLGYWLEHRDFVRAVAEKSAAGTSIESLRDGINPEMVTYVSALLRATTRTWGVAVAQMDLIIQGLLATWMRIGMQALFRPTVSAEEAEHALVTMTVGVLRQTMTTQGKALESSP